MMTCIALVIACFFQHSNCYFQALGGVRSRSPHNAKHSTSSTFFVIPSVRPSVCLPITTFSAATRNETIPTGSVPHWLYFKNGDFGKYDAFASYGVKQSEGANMQISTGPALRGARNCNAGRVSTPACYLVV